MTYYAGLDVSLRTVNLCVIDDQGELIAETKLDSEVTDIIAWLDGLELDIAQIGLEAGTLCQYLTYGLQSAGYGVVCMEARQVKAALSAMPTEAWRIERFNKSYRDEVLDAHLFATLDQVREISEEWKTTYNEYRPHDALGRIPPAMYMRNLKLENSSLELST